MGPSSAKPVKIGSGSKMSFKRYEEEDPMPSKRSSARQKATNELGGGNHDDAVASHRQRLDPTWESSELREGERHLSRFP